MTRDTFKAKGTPPPAAALGDAMRLVAKLAAHVRPTCSELWDEAQAFLATQHQEPTMTKAAGLLPAGRNPPAPEGSVKPAPPPNPPKAQEIEALRAEVERLQSDTSFATAISSLRREKERAERLAELLDQAYGYVPAGALADQIHCALLRDQEEGHD